MKLGGNYKVTLFQCSANEFLCLNNNMCIDKSKFCDKKDDCGDNSDEPLNCENNCAAAIRAFSPVFLKVHILNCLPAYNSHSLFLHKVSFSSNIQIKPFQILFHLTFWHLSFGSSYLLESHFFPESNLRRENWLQRRERYWPRWKCFKMLHGQLVYLNLFTNKSLGF